MDTTGTLIGMANTSTISDPTIAAMPKLNNGSHTSFVDNSQFNLRLPTNRTNNLTSLNTKSDKQNSSANANANTTADPNQPVKVKKTRAPRRKKILTEAQITAKRDKTREKNRGAASKCRLAKKAYLSKLAERCEAHYTQCAFSHGELFSGLNEVQNMVSELLKLADQGCSDPKVQETAANYRANERAAGPGPRYSFGNHLPSWYYELSDKERPEYDLYFKCEADIMQAKRMLSFLQSPARNHMSDESHPSDSLLNSDVDLSPFSSQPMSRGSSNGMYEEIMPDSAINVSFPAPSMPHQRSLSMPGPCLTSQNAHPLARNMSLSSPMMDSPFQHRLSPSHPQQSYNTAFVAPAMLRQGSSDSGLGMSPLHAQQSQSPTQFQKSSSPSHDSAMGTPNMRNGLLTGFSGYDAEAIGLMQQGHNQMDSPAGLRALDSWTF
ncbi:hypothetical protein ACMFMF_001880 [Clarireedia jacksonii]